MQRTIVCCSEAEKEPDEGEFELPIQAAQVGFDE